MKVKCFSSHAFEIKYLESWASFFKLKVSFTEIKLSLDSAVLAEGFDSVSCWASDDLSSPVLQKLKDSGVRFISLRSAGYSHLDLECAKDLGLTVTRVPSYSPESIAEHTLGLLMCLNRKFAKAFQRVRDFNFTLDGLEGVTLHGKTVGIVGFGKIGQAFARIMKGMGCNVLVFDPNQDENLAKDFGVDYTSLKELLTKSDIISLHCPLNKSTYHIINSDSINHIKPSAFLLNTGRGALIDTKALIEKLKKRELRGVGLDVYEYEENIFFKDFSEAGISDEMLLRLMGFPNVLITSHQAFFTKEALENIANISMENIHLFHKQKEIPKDNLLVQ
jgi:D-lactate dehydrogenase